mmetsp:Transcript_52296/g.151985  ORF Transcript_52296/g.151985 Transcript_52296/m.151985 type:complete len:691 (-) Transcript_52296:126-2198(-)
MPPKRRAAQLASPLCVKVAGDEVLREIGKLLQESEDVCDVVLKSGLRTCRCLLAAAAGPDLDLNHLIQALEKAETPVQRAFLDLIHGQEATLAGAATFFSLYEMAQRLKIKPCMEVCKHAVQESELDESMKLSLLLQHKEAIMNELKALREREQWTAKLKFTCDSGDDAELPCELPVHRVVLAASCQYLRGLWLGGFRETAEADCAAVRLQGTSKHMLQLLIDVAYGGEVSRGSMTELLYLFLQMDRWGFNLAAKSALGCISGRLNRAEAEQLLKQPSPLPPALLSQIAAVLNKSPPKTMPWGAATLLLRTSSEMKTIAPQLLSVARDVVGLCLCDPSAEKGGLSQLNPQFLASALPAGVEGHLNEEALLESLLQWAAQFPAPADTSTLPVAELSNLSALCEAVPSKDIHKGVFLGAFCRVLREKVFDGSRHELIASVLNRVTGQGKFTFDSKEFGGGSGSGSNRGKGEESSDTKVSDIVEVENSPPLLKRRRTRDPEEARVASAVGLSKALRKALRICIHEGRGECVRDFCSGPGLHALHTAAFIWLMSRLGEIYDDELLSDIISPWVLNASTDDVFEALRMGAQSCTSGITEQILVAARRRYSRVERLYLDAEGGKIEERIAHEVAAAKTAKEKAFQAKEAELHGQLEAARQELAEEKKQHSQDLAEARIKYLAAADEIFKSLAGVGS